MYNHEEDWIELHEVDFLFLAIQKKFFAAKSILSFGDHFEFFISAGVGSN